MNQIVHYMFRDIKTCFWDNHISYNSGIFNDHILFPYYQNNKKRDDELP
jgi:hypothetical protein